MLYFSECFLKLCRASQNRVQRRIAKDSSASLNLTLQLLKMVLLVFSPSFGALCCKGIQEAFYSGWCSEHSSEIQISVFAELLTVFAQCFLNLICI